MSKEEWARLVEETKQEVETFLGSRESSYPVLVEMARLIREEGCDLQTAYLLADSRYGAV